jgi:DNA adenine methylase
MKEGRTNGQALARPFVKWVGGKTQLISSIDKILPKEIFELPNLTYIEPFVGGGAVLFWILNNFKNINKAVINDINPDLVKSYLTVRDKSYELIIALKDIQNEYISLKTEEHRKDYFLAKRVRFNKKNLENIENTALFIFLNRTCFNGLYRVNSKGLFNVPFGKYSNPKICDEKNILADSELLQKVEILNGDFENTYNYVSQNTLFYFDPPYKPLSETSSFNSYAKEVFNDNEQIRLKKFCDKITSNGHYLMLSNSDVKSANPDNDFFDNLYSKYHIQRVMASRMVNSDANKRGKLSELLITNYLNEKPVYVPELV